MPYFKVDMDDSHKQPYVYFTDEDMGGQKMTKKYTKKQKMIGGGFLLGLLLIVIFVVVRSSSGTHGAVAEEPQVPSILRGVTQMQTAKTTALPTTPTTTVTPTLKTTQASTTTQTTIQPTTTVKTTVMATTTIKATTTSTPKPTVASTIETTTVSSTTSTATSFTSSATTTAIPTCSPGSNLVTIYEHNPPVGKHLSTIGNVSHEECQEHCQHVKGCELIAYRNSSCSMYEKGSETILEGFGFFKDTCVKSDRMCNASIHFETAEKKILVGFPEETLPAASIEECIALCLNSDEFEIPISCRSANFYPDDEECTLNGADRYTQPDSLLDDPYDNVVYIGNLCNGDHHENADEIRAEDAKDNSTEHLLEEEKTIHDPTHHELTNATTLPGNESTNASTECFVRVPQMALISESYFYVPEEVHTVDDCLQYCTTPHPEMEHECKSVEFYHDLKQCFIDSENRETARVEKRNGKDDTKVTYFEVARYLEKNPCATVTPSRTTRSMKNETGLKEGEECFCAAVFNSRVEVGRTRELLDTSCASAGRMDQDGSNSTINFIVPIAMHKCDFGNVPFPNRPLPLCCSSLAALPSESSPNQAMLLPQAPQTRSLFCNPCLEIVGVIDNIAGEDTAAIKQEEARNSIYCSFDNFRSIFLISLVCDNLCDSLFGGPHMASDLAPICKQWLDGDLYIIQLKLKNGWSPESICKEFKMYSVVSAEVTPECLDCLNKNNDKISKCMMCSFKKRAVEETAAEPIVQKRAASEANTTTRCSCDKIDDVRVCTYCVFTNFMKSECHTVSDCGRFRLNRHRRSINSISKYEASAIGFKKRETVAEPIAQSDTSADSSNYRKRKATPPPKCKLEDGECVYCEDWSDKECFNCHFEKSFKSRLKFKLIK
ncbi:hypothetical protein PRIPAC_84995 [Pristionchus pacificus]|uniref:Uncharacterized protein n=1 Tax=Pristionchus pacificus TaxID=54126 RepID=A0A2A6BMJ9_PRIPA|nr:hypothetical protein PRIPAC_84995 [Pristionchus pacificus]|eukprot:PDM67192.1 hypothetical protein PRIPAC_48609 [Pristionchus pacificus]